MPELHCIQSSEQTPLLKAQEGEEAVSPSAVPTPTAGPSKDYGTVQAEGDKLAATATSPSDQPSAPSAGCSLAARLNPFAPLWTGWGVYIREPVCLASVAMALLYMTTLSPHTTIVISWLVLINVDTRIIALFQVSQSLPLFEMSSPLPRAFLPYLGSSAHF